MPSHSKADLSVSALLRNLNEELDRKKIQKVENLLVSNAQRSVRCRLGPRVNGQDVQISHRREKGELCGVIFMCNRRTWRECLGQSLFGLPVGKQRLVEQVVPGMKLFLFEYERRQLWGVFEAISYGGMDIIPDAYSGGSFPCQVRVKVPEDCVALYEEEFYNTIKDNYFSTEKFHFSLSRNQVCELISLFERKYSRAKRMEPYLIEYEDIQCTQERYNPIGSLLLANEEAHVYPEDLNITALPHDLYASDCQIMQDGSFFDSTGMGYVYRNFENITNRIGRRPCETSRLVPLSNTIIQNNCLPLNVDVTRFTNIGGQLGDFGTGDMIPLYSTLTKQETIETVVIPGHVSQLHSDRPTGKSVWARISGRAKPLVAAELSSKQVKLPENPTQFSPPKVLFESVVAEVAQSPIQDDRMADMSEKATEECPVGFKRRRVSVNNPSANADEIPTSKQRRKLARPFFEASADEPLAEQMTTNADVLQESTVKMPLEEQHLLKTTICGANSTTIASLYNEKSFRTDYNNGDVALQVENATCQPAKLDLNLPLESQVEGFVNQKPHTEDYNDVSAGERREQEPCALALSLCCSQAHQLSQGEKETEMTSNLQTRREALQDDSTLHSDNVPINSVIFTKLVGKADAEHVICTLGIKEQKFDLLPHVISECRVLQSMAAEANTLSLAPCSPANDVPGSSGPAISPLYGEKGPAVVSLKSMQEIPLKLDAKLPDVEVQVDAVAPFDCTSGSSVSNSVDLKSILSGLQVSGVKLQLGSSPCLIFQLGDSSSSVDNQTQAETCTEISLKVPSSDKSLLERPSSS